MAKRSEIEKQIAALQADLDNADTDDEIWIKEGDREFKVTGKRATTVLSRFSDLFEESVPADGEEGEGEEGEGEPAGGGGYFTKKTKKAA